MRYRVSYRPDLNLETELIEAEELSVEGTNIVLRTTLLVMGQPRMVVVRRLRSSDVQTVDETN